jgi:paraquat-inducible protein A
VTGINIAQTFPDEARRLRILLAVTTFFLAVGLVAPIITMKKFVLVENTFSVFSGAIQLFNEGQFFLFIIIAGFSIVLPLLKIGVLNKLLSMKEGNNGDLDRYLHWMHLYGKWSMLDVFVVAILVVAVKLGAIASVEMRAGLYAFAAAVILTMFVTARVVSLTNRLEKKAEQLEEPDKSA